MKFLCTLLLSLFSLALIAQAPVIFLPNSSSEPEVRAAHILKFYLEKMTGQQVAISSNSKPPVNQPVVFIMNSPEARAFGFDIPTELSEDAFFLEGKNGVFALAGGGEMGTEYAAYTLLELLGCRKFSPRDSFIPNFEKIQLPDYQARIESPAFPYRELWYEPAFDENWARWHKLKTNPKKNEEWGMFVHTFEKLCPQEKHFATHPEYFSFNGAQRSPGQLCLSNDTVLQIVLSRLRELIQAKPEARYWSVSQNDNYDYCKCPRCAAVDQKHGSPAASLLIFVNKIAEAFPDKTISTLAYQYTRQTPNGIKISDNVSICLCSIECNRGQRIEEGCPDFARDVREWSALTKNLMIWDYVVQFRSYLAPFPNWHTLQPNLQFFEQNGVKMMFEQGSGRDRSEFSDMRAYLLAKLMWNPGANMDSILVDFGDGYYGEARADVWQYIHEQTERLKKHGNRLWIYDVPQNEAFVRDSIFERFLYPFSNLRSEVKDSVLHCRLIPIILSEYFSFLENLKCISPTTNDITQSEMRMLYLDSSNLIQLLRYFESNCLITNMIHLNENKYTATQYVQDYKDFLERSLSALFSRSNSIRLENLASPKYAKGDSQELTNKLVGETDYRYNWLGFEGTDLCAVLDFPDSLGSTLSTIQVSFLQDQASWVFYPQKVVFEISKDGQNFKTIQEDTIKIVPDGKKAFRTLEAKFPAASVRAVRITAFNQKTCPDWHTCNGNPCWIFADEIMVY
ncbi:MAG: DUF4838 domain-containing protein [Saprospiraceae bacterium]